jgi:SAM-dependent methyltransferase/uncharacterized protein YbaR (Trm112 family)
MDHAPFRHFSPICPACRARGTEASLSVAAWDTAAFGQGILACDGCASRFPVIDGVPVLVPDLAHYLNEAGVYLLARDDLIPAVTDLLGSVMQPACWFDAARHHLSGYVRDHWGARDPTDQAPPAPGQAWALAEAGLSRAGDISGPVIELGAAAGGVTRGLAERFDTQVLGLDLSAPLVRFAARALRGGRLRYPLRLSGTAYAEREIVVPPPIRGSATIWLADALVPPVAAGQAGLVVALNLLDCVADPAVLLRSATALLRPGGHLLLATPCDWNAAATPPEAWIGARSCAAASPSLAVWAASIAGLAVVAEVSGQSWDVRVHTRAFMRYEVDLLVLKRTIITT